MAERSKAPVSGTGPKGRGFKSHSWHILFYFIYFTIWLNFLIKLSSYSLLKFISLFPLFLSLWFPNLVCFIFTSSYFIIILIFKKNPRVQKNIKLDILRCHKYISIPSYKPAILMECILHVFRFPNAINKLACTTLKKDLRPSTMDVLVHAPVRALVVATSACPIFLQWWSPSACPIYYPFLISILILIFFMFTNYK